MVRNFRGQVKVADVQAEFDAIIDKINTVIDDYNETLDYDEEGIDYNIGSSEIAPIGYSLSVGALKKILGAYKGRVVGCNLYKKPSGGSNEYIVTNGLYITEDEETHLPKVLRLPTRDIYGDGDELWYSTEDDVYTLTGTYLYENVKNYSTSFTPSGDRIDDLIIDGNIGLVLNMFKIYYCDNIKSNNSTWTQVLSVGNAPILKKIGNAYICGSDNGIHYSMNGYSWTTIPLPISGFMLRVCGIEELNGNVYIAISSEDDGITNIYQLDTTNFSLNLIREDLPWCSTFRIANGISFMTGAGELMSINLFETYSTINVTLPAGARYSYALEDFCYYNGVYIAVGEAWEPTSVYSLFYATSSNLADGFSGYRVSTYQGYPTGLVATNNKLLLNCIYNNAPRIYKINNNGTLGNTIEIPTDSSTKGSLRNYGLAYDDKKCYLFTNNKVVLSRNGETFIEGTPILIEADLFIRKLNTNRDIPLCDSCFFESNNTPNYHVYTGAYPKYLGNNYTTPVSNKSGGIFVGVCESDRDGDYGAARLFGTEVFYEQQGGKRDKRTWSIPAYLWLPKGASQPYVSYGSEGIAFAKSDAIWVQDDW